MCGGLTGVEPPFLFVSDADDFAAGALVEPAVAAGEWGEGPCLAVFAEVVDGDESFLVEGFGFGVNDVDGAEDC